MEPHCHPPVFSRDKSTPLYLDPETFGLQLLSEMPKEMGHLDQREKNARVKA